MTNQLPAYLQNRQSGALAERAVQGLGSALPPHISIQGNQFTLIDAAGNEQPAGGTMDVCIVDVSDVNCKKYFGKEWTPDSNDAPMCWSANGIGPSREAQTPQAPTCADCRHNVRGSAISKISGAQIKACRDEKWLALHLPQFPKIPLFQLVLTPGSFTNWKSYVQVFESNKGNGAVDISDVITRVSFEPKVNGVLQFQASSYIDEPTYKLREQLVTEKATVAIVGRNDVPRGSAVPTTTQQPALEAPKQPDLPFGGPDGQPATFPAGGQTSTAGAAAEPQGEPVRRRRRSAAQPDTSQQQPAQMAPVTAPFRPAPGTTIEAQPDQTPPNNFGMQQPVAADPGMQAAINSIFK